MFKEFGNPYHDFYTIFTLKMPEWVRKRESFSFITFHLGVMAGAGLITKERLEMLIKDFKDILKDLRRGVDRWHEIEAKYDGLEFYLMWLARRMASYNPERLESQRLLDELLSGGEPLEDEELLGG